MKKTAFLVLALVLVNGVTALSAFYSEDYTLVTDETAIAACAQYVYDNTSRSIQFKMTVNVDAYEELSRRWCINGAYANMPYERHIWVNNDALNSFLEVSVTNYHALVNIFESDNKFRKDLGVLNNEKFVHYGPAFTVNPVNNANGFLLYDTSRGSDYRKDDAGFYYAIGVGQGEGMSQFYNYLTGNFASADDFEEAGLGYPPDDLSNPLVLEGVGSTCGAYKCVTSSQLDVDLNNPQAQAFFAFTNDFNYYYYPYYIESVNYVVTGTSSNGTNIYTRKGSIPTSSTEIYFPELSTRIGNFDRFRILDDSFDFGSRVNYDGSLATLPPDVTQFDLQVDINYRRNNLYRHESPADASWSIYNITAPLGEACADGNIPTNQCESYTKRQFTSSFYLHRNISGTGTDDLPVTPPSDYDNSSPEMDFETNVTDTSPPVLGGGGGGGILGENIGNGTGVDWSHDPNGGGSLQGQVQYAEGRMAIEDKASFFIALQTIANTILEIILTVFMLGILVISMYVFFIMIPSAYRKLLDELKRLGDMKWR